MKKKMLKKSDVLREGYIQGLKKAQSIINEMIDLTPIEKYCMKITSICCNVSNKSYSEDGEDFDSDYYYDHIPGVSIDGDWYGDIRNVYYDTGTDELRINFKDEPTIFLKDFSEAFDHSTVTNQNRTFHCEVEYDDWTDWTTSKVTIFIN